LSSGSLRRAVFLDRDGVINKAVVRNGKPYPPASMAETEILPDACSSLLRLKDRGFLLIVVTNQPDVSRGAVSKQSVEEIHKHLNEQLPVDAFAVCYHDDADGCHCRKPLPGLILDTAALYNVSLNESFLIGDRWRDIDAGGAAGCATVLIDYGYNERSSFHSPDARVDSLSKAVDWILEHCTE
jgi:D-glycero-D-manno-heptose 1,7-bisphosphate phosphatase